MTEIRDTVSIYIPDRKKPTLKEVKEFTTRTKGAKFSTLLVQFIEEGWERFKKDNQV